MANIRGFGDIRDERNGRGGFGGGGGGPGGGGGEPEAADSQAIFRLLGADRTSNKHPKDETFLEMLHYNFCPTLRFKSLNGILIPILIVLYLISLFADGIYREGEFLEVDNGAFFRAISQNGRSIRLNYQYWRLVTACFFHLYFVHIVMNCVSMIIWGSFVESFIGTTKYSIIFFVSGVTGNLLSVVCKTNLDSYSVGASGCITGVTGAIVGMLILNWMALGESQYRAARGYLTCIVIIITIFVLLFTLAPQAPNVNTSITTDQWAHLGGLLGGFFLSMAIGKVFGRNDTTYEKRVRIIGWVCFGGLVLGTFIPLLAVKPKGA